MVSGHLGEADGVVAYMPVSWIVISYALVWHLVG
jgi:hypothetical protein